MLSMEMHGTMHCILLVSNNNNPYPAPAYKRACSPSASGTQHTSLFNSLLIDRSIIIYLPCIHDDGDGGGGGRASTSAAGGGHHHAGHDHDDIPRVRSAGGRPAGSSAPTASAAATTASAATTQPGAPAAARASATAAASRPSSQSPSSRRC